jgi:acyl carrier protein
MTTFDKIRDLIAKYKNIDIESIKPESTLDDLGLDSLDMFQIIFEAEEVFDIEIDNLDEEIKTINDIVNLIGKK